jgi:hypothetical protein
MGAQNPYPSDARWSVAYQTGRHPTSCRASGGRDEELQCTVRGGKKSIVSVPGFALTENVEMDLTDLLQMERNKASACQFATIPNDVYQSRRRDDPCVPPPVFHKPDQGIFPKRTKVDLKDLKQVTQLMAEAGELKPLSSKQLLGQRTIIVRLISTVHSGPGFYAGQVMLGGSNL